MVIAVSVQPRVELVVCYERVNERIEIFLAQLRTAVRLQLLLFVI
jgi:hypothetical protein